MFRCWHFQRTPSVRVQWASYHYFVHRTSKFLLNTGLTFIRLIKLTCDWYARSDCACCGNGWIHDLRCGCNLNCCYGRRDGGCSFVLLFGAHRLRYKWSFTWKYLMRTSGIFWRVNCGNYSCSCHRFVRIIDLLRAEWLWSGGGHYIKGVIERIDFMNNCNACKMCR